ncbi:MULTISPECIES: GntR family transcriptional regulator [Lactobacillus]|jgi:GntR family transcriptional regulator|uniref:GntR family transcriptional regulator n=2 Tax=Lactobacillus bombicola TaxID=1505723 RepID=A0A396SLA1_9LACO|nr:MULTISPECIES: GntR family transcriptional regulator [Lactobacillus]RHW49301.1 GntR family transcriptional regulator [Lactobacillus bombicola]RHW52462.1 GntR family transcriptional regulator [Lactobacillus bombicola]RHW53887.1 GntR family transcriptional regulator [Lactobacillus bombicola]RMC41287.1 GntR family transcriptional regulator [Lactobacillus sp. ESL0237]RMC42406.1 GntR family transcriptional regulator [Lactobacillus sp. ESL0233]
MEEPMYIKIHNQIKREIESHIYKVGSRIPSERQLALKFGVSRMTLRQAIKTLEDEGILEQRLGSGTYVANQKVQEKMSGIMSFTDITHANGQIPSSKLISYRVGKPSLSEMERLHLAKDQTILRMERIRYADNVPICYEVVTIPHKLILGMSKENISTHLYRTLEQNGYEIGRVTEHISAAIANENAARLLNAKKGEALITRLQVTELSSGEPFEYTRASYVADRFEFTFSK